MSRWPALVLLLAALPSAHAAARKFLRFLATPASTKEFRAIGLAPAS
jgi:hypothetical protein